MFAGGGEELDWTLSVLFDAMGAMSSKFNDSPERASRAYDKDRDGSVISGGGGILVLVGYRARHAALAIAIFCVVAALVFHRYWSLPADRQMADYLFFWKDLAMAGGMLMVFAFGPGRFSIDKG